MTPQHKITLEAVSKNHQVGGKIAITGLYLKCLDVFNGDPNPDPNKYGVWVGETKSVRVVAITDLTTGIYVQLSQESAPNSALLLTVGKKFCVEIHDPVTSTCVMKYFN